MFFFDPGLLAAELAGYSLAVDTMVCTPAFNAVTFQVRQPVDTMVCTPTFNAAGMTPLWMSVSTMAINVAFNNVRMRAPGGQPFLGGSAGFNISRSVARSINEKWS
jgi:hypothetical protein